MVRGMLVISMAALLVAGCSTMRNRSGIGGSGTTVQDSQLARLPPESMSRVDQDRMEVQRANDRIARAEAGIQDAKSQLSVAKSEKKGVENRSHTANKSLEAAEKAHNDAAAEASHKQIDELKPAIDAADQRVLLAQARLDAAQSRRALAERERTLAQAHLDQSKYQALTKANDPAAQKYKAPDFEKRISDAEGEQKKARVDLQQKEQYARSREQSWRSARQRVEASSQPPPG